MNIGPQTTTIEAFDAARKYKGKTSADRSREAHNYAFRKFSIWLKLNSLAKKPIADLRRRDILLFLDYLIDEDGMNLGNKTRNNIQTMISAQLTTMVEREVFEKNPAFGIPKLPVNGTSNIPLTTQDRKILESYLLKENPRLYYFTRHIYYMFMRPKEVLETKAIQYNLRDQVALIWSGTTKTRRQLPVILVPRMVELIKESGIPRVPGSLYPYSRKLVPGNLIWNRNRVSEMHRKALEACDLLGRGYSMYAWKHLGICDLYEQTNGDVEAVRQQARHQNLNDTARYLRSMGKAIPGKLKTLHTWR